MEISIDKACYIKYVVLYEIVHLNKTINQGRMNLLYLGIKNKRLCLHIACLTDGNLSVISDILFQDMLGVGLIVPQLQNQARLLGCSHLLIGTLGAVYSGTQLVSGPVIVSINLFFLISFVISKMQITLAL